MEKVELEAKIRKEKGKSVGRMRRTGIIPAIVYGRGIEPVMLTVENKRFNKVVTGESGLNVIIDLVINDDGKTKSLPVITHEIDKDPITDIILHIDFKHLVMDEAIKTKVHIELEGDTPVGVKNGGVLVHSLREVEVKCLPMSIPDKFVVNVANLEIGQSLHVSDLTAPKDVEIITDMQTTVATITAATKEEDLKPAVMPEVPAVEGAAPAEGAAAAQPEAGKAAETPAKDAKAPAADKKAPEAKKPEAKK